MRTSLILGVHADSFPSAAVVHPVIMKCTVASRLIDVHVGMVVTMIDRSGAVHAKGWKWTMDYLRRCVFVSSMVLE